MIQRKQSIFLLIALICFGLGWIWPLAESELSQHPFLINDGAYTLMDHMVLMAMNGVALLMIFIALLSFRNRPLQVRFSYGSCLMALAIPVLAWTFLYNDAPREVNYENLELGWGPFVYVPAFLFLIMAIRAIRKDERLVRSADSLR